MAEGGSAGPIWLTGMMGAGKSTTGAALAARLGLFFVDADRYLEERVGRSIPEIFGAEGEAGFRAHERAALAALAEGGTAVVGLGGGALESAESRALVARTGRAFYLQASLDTLCRRVGSGAGRPLLAGLDAAGRRRRLAELLARREPQYREVATPVATDGLAPEAVAERIAALLSGAQKGSDCGAP